MTRSQGPAALRSRPAVRRCCAALLALLALSSASCPRAGARPLDSGGDDGGGGGDGNGAASARLRRSPYHRAFPMVEPDASHTKLTVVPEGLAAIARLPGPLAIVAVIGPYRSGKSFLLNQLLALSCDEGFGVGHMRDTKTKGIWAWGEPTSVTVDGVEASLIFLDTEGFESIGKSNVYDDRIFALAAILSSVLVYNLPETVREADIAKLSFAVELAEEFYGRFGRDSIFQPAKLLWLIQRDFLEGKTVQQMVDEALATVPNDSGDRDIEQVNQIRKSLAIMGGNSTAFGLRQPHLARTKLCELDDSELDGEYIRQRGELREKVTSLASPKLVQGKTLSGKAFVALLEQTVEALNKGKIPSAGSVIDEFNRAVMARCMAAYRESMGRLKLPTAESTLDEAHEAAANKARDLFELERFGKKDLRQALVPLNAEIMSAYDQLREANVFESSKGCQKTYADCDDAVSSLQNMRLPSMAKFESVFSKCNKTSERVCTGPLKDYYHDRLQKMWIRERAQFVKDYNQRLFNWLVVFSLVMVVMARFFLKWAILEVCAWALFVFLETYMRMFSSAEGLKNNDTWRTVIAVWEAVVFNPLLDLDRWAVPLAWLLLLSLVLCRYQRWQKQRQKKGKKASILPISEPLKSTSSRYGRR
eukprot:SM000025S08423  [mRNA]  locus=s25:657110:662613:- [translate_table: standard]